MQREEEWGQTKRLKFFLSKFNHLRDKNGKNCALWENIKMKIIFLWTRAVVGWKKKTRWTGDGKNVCDDAAKSVKHSTIEEKNLEKKFSRHVFEQFLSICFIHLHVCLTNSKIKELRLPSAYSCSVPLMLGALIRITALTAFQCRVKSSDTKNRSERATRNWEDSLPAQAAASCLSRRHELIIRHAVKFSLSLGEPFPVRRKRGALKAWSLADWMSWRSYLRILLTEVRALELTRHCVWHNLTSNYFLS